MFYHFPLMVDYAYNWHQFGYHQRDTRIPMETSIESNTNISNKTSSLIIAGLFSGMLKAWQVTAFGDLVHAGVDKQIAHKVCSDYGADLGRAISTDGKFKSKIGKLDNDGNRKIGMAGKASIKTSNSMSVIYVAQTMDTLYSEELLAGRKLPQLSAELESYMEECQEWCDGQEWKEEKK